LMAERDRAHPLELYKKKGKRATPVH
jgi:hypothetical protein